MAFGGDLVVRLGMDSKRFSRGLRKSTSSVRSFARTATSLLGGVALALGGRESIRAYEEQRVAIAKLESVLRSTGNAAGLTSDQIQKFASARQAVTNFGDEVSIAGASVLATFKNIQGQAFLDTLAVAQDVSAVMGQDLQSSIVQLGKAMNDPVAGLSALSRVGITFNEQQKEQIKSLQESGDLMGAQSVIMAELQSQFGGAAEAARSPFTALANTFGDLTEKVGELIAGGSGGSLVGWLEGVVQQMIRGTEVVIGWRDAFVDWTTSAMASTDGVFGAILSGVSAAVGAVKKLFFGIVNFGLSWEVAKEASVNFFNNTVARFSWFIGVVGDFFGWFGRNWRSVFTDVFNISVTIFANLGANIKSIFSSLWDVISSGFTKSFEPQLVSLTKGFKSTIAEEFKIKEFVAPEAKKDAINKFNDAFKEWENMGQETAKNALETPTVASASSGAVSYEQQEQKKDSKEQRNQGPTDAISLNSSEGLKAIFNATMGGKKRPEDQTAKNTGVMAATLASIDRKLDGGSAPKLVGAPS